MADLLPPTDAELLAVSQMADMDPALSMGWRNVSHSIFSLGRGRGAIINGHHYAYFATDDSLWRDDVVRAVVKMRRAMPGPVAQPTNLELF